MTPVYSDRDAIELVTSVHKDSVKELGFFDLRDKFSLDYDSYCELFDDNREEYTVTYNLKNGKKVTRNIALNSDEIYELCRIETTDEYVNNIKKIAYAIAKEYNTFSVSTLEKNYIMYPETYYNEELDEHINLNKDYDYFASELIPAVVTDLSNRALEQVRNPVGIYSTLSIGNITLFVYENDENIIRVIEKYKSVMESELNVYYYYGDFYYDDYDDEEEGADEAPREPFVAALMKGSFVEKGYNFGRVDDVFFEYQESDLYADEDIMNIQKKLMQNLKPYTFDENDTYAVYINNSGFHGWWYIPSELSDDAQKLFNYASEHTTNSEGYYWYD